MVAYLWRVWGIWRPLGSRESTFCAPAGAESIWKPVLTFRDLFTLRVKGPSDWWSEWSYRGGGGGRPDLPLTLALGWHQQEESIRWCDLLQPKMPRKMSALVTSHDVFGSSRFSSNGGLYELKILFVKPFFRKTPHLKTILAPWRSGCWSLRSRPQLQPCEDCRLQGNQAP